MIRSINTVKKEIRILGLDSCRPGQVFGAIVRGGQFLDGVLRMAADREVPLKIVESIYFPELRAVMLHDPIHRLDGGSIERHTGLPVIHVGGPNQPGRGYSRFESGMGSMWVKTGIPAATVERVLARTWTLGKFPEPVRIAHLLARTRVPLMPRGDKQ